MRYDPGVTARKEPSARTRLTVWARSAGRCTFCNRLVTENEEVGEEVPIGELAHNVGWGDGSPRGNSSLTEEQRREAANLLLLCRNCHKPIDDGGVVGRYSVEELARRKHEHEARIAFLTGIGADRGAVVVRVVGPIRGRTPELAHDTVLTATTAAGYFPRLLPGAYRAELDLDLRHLGETETREHFETCAARIDELVARLHDGVRRDDVTRVAVFAFARIPVLVHLGAALGDKFTAVVFQRQRGDERHAWRWRADDADAVDFEFSQEQAGEAGGRVAVVVNVSGTIKLDELPRDPEARSVYVLGPVGVTPNNGVITVQSTLRNFDASVRALMGQIEAEHGKVQEVDLFAAAPVSAAVTLGRVLSPSVSPAWRVYDRDEHGQFLHALTVRG